MLILLDLYSGRLFESISVVSSPEIVLEIAFQSKKYCTANKTCTLWSAIQKPQRMESSWNIDFGIVISFGYFIPKRILSCFPRGIVNLHPSLLPKYRGAAPILHTLVNGDRIGGVSIIELHPERFDAGRILSQVAFPITLCNAFMLSMKKWLFKRELAQLVEVLCNFPHYQEHAQETEWILSTQKLQNHQRIRSKSAFKQCPEQNTKPLPRNRSFI